MQAIYRFQPINQVYTTLKEIFPNFPKPDKLLKNFYAIEKEKDDLKIYLRLTNRFIVFNEKDQQLGTGILNIETKLTTESSSEEIKKMVQSLYAFHHKELSIIHYRAIMNTEHVNNSIILPTGMPKTL